MPPLLPPLIQTLQPYLQRYLPLQPRPTIKRPVRLRRQPAAVVTLKATAPPRLARETRRAPALATARTAAAAARIRREEVKLGVKLGEGSEGTTVGVAAILGADRFTS